MAQETPATQRKARIDALLLKLPGAKAKSINGDHLPIGQARITRPGKHATVVAYSAMVHEAVRAADRLAQDGWEIEVVDLRSVKPLDLDTVLASVARTGRCVIVHEAPRTAGFGAEIAAQLAEKAMFDLVAPVERVTGFDTHIPLFRLEMKYLPSVEKIIAAVKRTLAVS